MIKYMTNTLKFDTLKKQEIHAKNGGKFNFYKQLYLKILYESYT